jgi:hypothetical protein
MTDTEYQTTAERAAQSIYQAESAADRLIVSDTAAYAQARATLAVAWWLRAAVEELEQLRRSYETRP